jgi:hypothetical protein
MCIYRITELIDVTFHIEEFVLKDIRWIDDNFGLWWSSVAPSINETHIILYSFYFLQNCFLYLENKCMIKVTNLNFDDFPVFWPFNKIQICVGCLKSNETGSDSHLQ